MRRKTYIYERPDRLGWFLTVLDQALSDAEKALGTTLRKSRFWTAIGGTPLNERQRSMLNRLLDGFEGKLTTSMWGKIAKCSQDAALRDISEPDKTPRIDPGSCRRPEHQL
jgi:Fic family protein